MHNANDFEYVEPRFAAGCTGAKGAFTLIELLVVISIIVVLLALLTPALDEALYQAELAVCQAQMRTGAAAVIRYTMDNKRAYPFRQGPRDEALQWVPNEVASTQYDDRDAIYSAVPPELTLDPFCPEIDPVKSGPGTFVTVHYNLWFGWRYQRGANEAGMYRYGNRFTWTDSDGVRSSYSVLMTDDDRFTGNLDISSHPDRDDGMYTESFQDAPNLIPFFNIVGQFVTMSYWRTAGAFVRGPLDLNYAYDDGSARRLNYVTIKDPRVDLVPDHTFQTASSTGVAAWRQIPAQ